MTVRRFEIERTQSFVVDVDMDAFMAYYALALEHAANPDPRFVGEFDAEAYIIGLIKNEAIALAHDDESESKSVAWVDGDIDSSYSVREIDAGVRE
jgi:hypothetical protein